MKSTSKCGTCLEFLTEDKDLTIDESKKNPTISDLKDFEIFMPDIYILDSIEKCTSDSLNSNLIFYRIIAPIIF